MEPRLLNRVDPRRLIDRRKVRPEHIIYADICVSAHCRFIGVNSAVPECGLEALVIFLDSYGSSLALPVSQFTFENVKAHLAKSDAKWQAVDA